MEWKYNISSTVHINNIFHYKLSIHNKKDRANDKKNRGVDILKNLQVSVFRGKGKEIGMVGERHRWELEDKALKWKRRTKIW